MYTLSHSNQVEAPAPFNGKTDAALFDDNGLCPAGIRKTSQHSVLPN